MFHKEIILFNKWSGMFENTSVLYYTTLQLCNNGAALYIVELFSF